MGEAFFKELRAIVERNLSNPDFTVEVLCRLTQMSQPTLYRKINKATGKNPSSFIRYYRLTRAAEMLETRTCHISEVAKKVGFEDMSYFARCFRDQFQCLPSDIITNGTVVYPNRITHESKIDGEFVEEMNRVINNNLSDPEFNVARLASTLYLDRSTLYRKVIAIYGESPSGIIRSCRLKRGAQLLGDNFGNVTEVAFAVGFPSSSYFAECFKKMFHQLPGDYMASRKNEGDGLNGFS